MSPEGEKPDRGQGCNPNILHLDVLRFLFCFHFIPQRERTKILLIVIKVCIKRNQVDLVITVVKVVKKNFF